jgi:dienelactone hydrolase
MRAWLPPLLVASLLGCGAPLSSPGAGEAASADAGAEADAAPLAVQPSPLPEGVLGASRRPPLTDDPHALTAAARGTEGLAASVPVQPPWRPTVDVGEAERARAAVCAGGAPSLHWPHRADDTDPATWRASVRDFVTCALGLDGHAEAPLELAIDGMQRIEHKVTRLAVRYRAGSTGDEEAGRQIPAFLFVPDAPRPVPAVIVYHGHGDGKINVAERAGTAENALGLRIALDLGYVVLAPDARSFGAAATGPHAAYWQGLPRTPDDNFMSRLARDGYQDMALLRALPSVDPRRVGVAGVSLGAWRAVLQGLVQRDVGPVVASGLFVPLGYLFSNGHDGCQHLPALADRLDMEDLGAALAPGGLLVQWGARDWFYNVNDAEGVLRRTQGIAEAQGFADGVVRDVHATVGHQFVVASTEAFLRARLGPGAWDGPPTGP